MSLTCLRTASWTLFVLVLESWWGHRPGWGSCLWGGQAAVSSGAGVTLLHDFGPQMPHRSVALALPAGLLGGPQSHSHGPRLAAKAQVLCTVRHPREWHQGPVLPCLAMRRERKVSFNSGTICFISNYPDTPLQMIFNNIPGLHAKKRENFGLRTTGINT